MGVALQNKLESAPHSCFIWKSLIGVHSSLNIWLASLMKPFGAGLSFVRSFPIMDLISSLVIGLLKFSILSWVSVGNLCASRIYLFHLGYLLFWHRAIHSIALKSFCFLMTGNDVSTFISDVICLVLLPVSLAKSLSILLLFQGINLVSLIIIFLFSFLKLCCNLYFLPPASFEFPFILSY